MCSSLQHRFGIVGLHPDSIPHGIEVKPELRCPVAIFEGMDTIRHEDTLGGEDFEVAVHRPP
jgi:hypothetical protein